MKWFAKWCVCLSVMLVCTQGVWAQTSFLPVERRMLFNDWPRFAQESYFNPYWTHEGPEPAGRGTDRKSLLAGTNHLHTTVSGSRTNVWKLSDCRTGTSAALGQEVPPLSYATIATNWQASLQNSTKAVIETPYYPEGVGTIYFEAINVTVAETNQLTVEIATNMLEYTYLGGDVSNVMFETEGLHEGGAVYSNNWQVLSVIPLQVSDNVPVRYKRTLNYRQSARIRIRRTGPVYSYPDNNDNAFVAVDNICVSLPPSDVVIRSPQVVFNPGYPFAGGGSVIRCYVDNRGTNAYERTASGLLGADRACTVHYRWRYLDQMSNAWATVPMTYVQGSGVDGNGELYEAALPAQSQVGDLEYYFTCAFGGYRYQPYDYTEMGYNYWPSSPEGSESLSPQTFRGGAAEPDGREFYARLRPFSSRFGSVSVVTGPYSDENPIAMTLISNDVWRGLVPINNGGITNLDWYFKGENAYVEGTDTFSPNPVYWSQQSPEETPHAVPYGGQCVETSYRPQRIKVSAASGGYVQIIFNSSTLEYMASRGEYQNFNAWPAPPDTFTESSGQASKQRLLNTFDAWPANVTDDEYLQEYFKGVPADTNVFVREPTPTFNGWLRGSAGYVVDRLAADIANNPGTSPSFRNVALRLRGGGDTLGLGYVHNTENTLSDGVRQLSFKARLGQTATRYDVAYHKLSFASQNYLIRANVKADAGMSPESPSYSLIGYFSDPDHFYEYRIVQIPDTANLTRDKRVSHQIYKWTNGVEVLLVTTSRNEDLNLTQTIPMELRLYTDLGAGKTEIRCKFSNTEVLSYSDSGQKGGSPIQSGTFGLLSKECRSGFSAIYTQGTTTGAAAVASPAAVLVLDPSSLANFNQQIVNWSTPAGRFEGRSDYSLKGIYAVIPTQKIGLYLQKTEFGTDEAPTAPGTLDWALFKETDLTGFGYASYSVPVYYWRSHFAMLQVMGRSDQLQVDVVVDELAVSSWRGQLSSDLGEEETDNDNVALNTDWVATEAWVVASPVAGLNEGRLSGDFNLTQRSPMTSVQLGTRYANISEGWVTNTTYVYNGYIWLDGTAATNVFSENFSGNVMLKIDNTVVLNDANPNSPTTNLVVLARRWYRFELRLGYGTVGTGGPAAGGLFGGYGVAYSRNVGQSWVPYVDSGDGYFLYTDVKDVWLDHSRGGKEIDDQGNEGNWLDQAVRSPLLLNGVGMLEFDYSVLRAPAKLTVQFAPSWDSAAWVDIQSRVVSNVSAVLHEQAYVGTNVSGYLRVLNDRRGGYTNALVEINNGVAWDEPNVDDTSWRAYNVKITDTDVQRIMLDESKACFLNNSQYADADPDQTLYAEAFVKSPLLPSGLGTLWFMARAYSNSQPATVSVWVTTVGPRAPEAQWTKKQEYVVSSLLYQTYTYIPDDGRSIRAVKLVTSTTGTGRRACLEEIVVSEPIFPGFEITNVKALCKESNGEYSETRFQPLDSDEVGIQAQIDNIQLSPQNIRMFVSYYVGTNMWGVGNWPTNKVVTEEMFKTEENPLIYRTSPYNDIPFQLKDEVVQYQVWATYEDEDGVALETRQTKFDSPEWYEPVNLNQTYAALGFSPYYIVYGVPVGAVWINEINVVDDATNSVRYVGENQYIEIAVPAGFDLAGWNVDLVDNNRDVTTITIPAGLQAQTAVTNGYAFFVIGDHSASRNQSVPVLPKIDLEVYRLSWYLETTTPGGIRLRRPFGMYEHSVAYDWDPTWGGIFSGETWAAEDPEGKFEYVGREDQGGSLNVTNTPLNALPGPADWVFPLTWTPGLPNIGQTVPDANLMAPGVSNVVIISEMPTAYGTQDGKRTSPYSFKVRKGSDTNINYVADSLYRLRSIKVNGVEQLTSGEVASNKLELVSVQTNLSVVVTVGLRDDLASLALSGDMMDWLLSYGDAPLAPTYYYGRELSLTEQFWIDANPTTTNYLEGGILKVERDPAATNYLMTAWLALNGTNVTKLLGISPNSAVFKVMATQRLSDPDWTMLSQYVFSPDSFDSNHTTRVFIPNPFPTWFPDGDAKQLYFRWRIEYEDPRFSTPVLLYTNAPTSLP